MARTKRVGIAGREWKVKVPHAPIRGAWGHCDAKQKIITLCPTTAKHGVARETLIHELLHAALWILDEDVVRQLAVDIDDALDVCEDGEWLA